MIFRRPAVWGVPVVVLALAASAFLFTGDEVDVAAPDPDAGTRRMCAALTDAVPDSVAGLERRKTEPGSRFTAAWGDPAVVLRCGVDRPEAMNDPNSPGGEVSGVGWLLEEGRDGGHRCTTTLRKAFVEVSVPGEYGDVTALTDLARAIRATVPAGV